MLRIDATFHKATPKAPFSAMRSEDAEKTGGVGLLVEIWQCAWSSAIGGGLAQI